MEVRASIGVCECARMGKYAFKFSAYLSMSMCRFGARFSSEDPEGDFRYLTHSSSDLNHLTHPLDTPLTP